MKYRRAALAWAALGVTALLAGSAWAGAKDVQAEAARKKALDEDISPDLKDVLRRQMGTVQATHDQVKALRNATD